MTIQAAADLGAGFDQTMTVTPSARGSVIDPLARSRELSSRAIGALFPLGFLVYGVGFGLVMSVVGTPGFLANIAQHQTTLALGAFLMLLNTAVDIGKGVLMFPVLENHGKRTALAYLVGMLLEVALMAVGIVSLLLLIPLGQHAIDTGAASTDWVSGLGLLLIHSNELAYQIAMLTLAVTNVIVWSLTFRVRLLPRWLSVWGVLGYIVLAAGTIAELFGIPLALMSTIPGGLFEITLGTWLIIKGFEPAAYAKITV